MTNTYEDAAEAEADRAQQLRLLAVLGAWDRALRRDELAARCIQGTRGSIYTSGDGKTWVAHIQCRSARHWSAVRAKPAAFATITQDGDEEGVARLHGLPTAGTRRGHPGGARHPQASGGLQRVAGAAARVCLRVTAAGRGGFRPQERWGAA